MNPIITLTMREIIELADFAGLVVDSRGFEGDMDTEFSIADCPAEGLSDEGEPTDVESRSHFRRIAYYTETPEEGCIGLGPECPPQQQGAADGR